MENQHKVSNKPLHYAKISLNVSLYPIQERMKLVQMVFQKSISITKAAKKLSIKLSTAKLILKKYREEGAFFEKRSDRMNRLHSQKGINEMAPTSPTIEPSTTNQNIEALEQPPASYAITNVLYPPSVNSFLIYGNMNGVSNNPWGCYGNYGSVIYGSLPYYY